MSGLSAAAQSPLSAAVQSRYFRDDLLARLAGMSVSLPPLRERPADVAPLFQHFINHYAGGRPPELEAKLVESLCVYDWPSNVRELEQLSRQLLAVHGLEPMLKRSQLPAQLLARLPPTSESIPPPANGEQCERRDHDLQRLAVALRKTQGNVASASALLGFSRQRAYDCWTEELLPRSWRSSQRRTVLSRCGEHMNREQAYEQDEARASGLCLRATRRGEILGDKYRLLDVIGAGGMAEVYSAEHRRLGRRFAVKVLRAGPSRQNLQRFRHEASAMARIDNEFVVGVIDFGEAGDGTPYLVMDLLHGEDLRSLLDRECTLPIPRAVNFIWEACQGIAAVHAVGLVHRDLKPGEPIRQ